MACNLFCGKDIVYVEPHKQVFDENYMESKGIKLVVEDVDGDQVQHCFENDSRLGHRISR